MDLNFLSNKDIDTLRRIVGMMRSGQLDSLLAPRQAQAVGDELMTPEVYVAFVADGIPGRDAYIPGVAECPIYRMDDGALEEAPRDYLPVYNLSRVAVRAGQFVLVQREKYSGAWLTTGELAESDLEVGTGTGTAGTTGPGFSGVSVRRTAVQVVNNGADADLLWTTENYDTDGYHDTGSNTERLTAPEAGYYIVGYNIAAATSGYTTPDGSQVGVSLLKNGSTLIFGETFPDSVEDEFGSYQFHHSEVLYLAAGEYVTLHGYATFSSRQVNFAGTAQETFWMARMEAGSGGGGGGGSGTVTSVDITAPAAGITASGGPITTSGSITLALANDLAALEGLSGTGFAERTGSDTWTTRTLVVGDLPELHGFTNATPGDSDRFPFYKDATGNRDCAASELADYILGKLTAGGLPALNGFTNATLADDDRVPFYDDGAAANRDCSALEMKTYCNPLIILRDEKTQNTDGGTFTSGAWRTRDLNTEAVDTDNNCSLSSNQFTLSEGTYEIRAKAPAALVNRHQIRLQNVTDGSTILTGCQAISGATDNTQTDSVLEGRFTIGASKALEIQHQCQTTYGTGGFGLAGNFTTEVYTVVVLRKVG